VKTVLIDTHCHLHDRDFFTEAQAEEMLKRAKEKGVEKIICIGTHPEDSIAAKNFAAKHENVYWTYGVHPSEKNTKDLFEKDDKLVAIGEVGLDYHYDDAPSREEQIKLFEEMLQLASDNDLPVSFHVREAFDDFFEIIKKFPKVKGVVHSFSDSKKNLKKILENTDFYIGVNGLATYSTLPTPPLDRIVLETDAPFLTPTPFRGIINESGYVREIAEWLALKLDVSFDQVERETTKNAEKIFKI
jgi:TatD DNase family protein